MFINNVTHASQRSSAVLSQLSAKGRHFFLVVFASFFMLSLQLLNEFFLLVENMILLVKHLLESLYCLLSSSSHFRPILIVLCEHLVSVFVNGILYSFIFVTQVLVVCVPSFHSLNLGSHTMNFLVKQLVFFSNTVKLSIHFRFSVRCSNSCTHSSVVRYSKVAGAETLRHVRCSSIERLSHSCGLVHFVKDCNWSSRDISSELRSLLKSVTVLACTLVISVSEKFLFLD